MFLYLFFICILCIVTITDLRRKTIPNRVILVALFVKFIHTITLFFLEKANQPQDVKVISLLTTLLILCFDGLAVSIPLLFLVLIMERIRKKEAMGGGDIKLLFVTGLYLGWERNLRVLLLASLLGVVFLLIKDRKVDAKKEDTFPFGPMIAIASVVCMWI
ncbi:MAG: prepilin peptidase [Agathobacter sp.]|nr:prepilin peptidase [Agathobacter sp.]